MGPNCPKRLILAQLNIKQEARRLVENLGEDATWDDLMYQIYFGQAVDAGIEDSQVGRTIDLEEVRAKLGLDKRGYAGQITLFHNC